MNATDGTTVRAAEYPWAIGVGLLLVLAASAAAAGAPWQALGPYGGSITAIAVSPANPDTVYAAASSVGVFRSQDGGRTWSRTGLSTEAMVSAIVIDSGDAQTVYAATSNGFFASGDGGTSWGPRNQGLKETYLTALAADPLHPGTLYSGAWGGVFKTANAGGLWEDLSTGLPAGTYVAALALDPHEPGALYAATGERGVWRRTSDVGWVSASKGLPEMNIRDLLIDPDDPKILYAATDTQGVWRSDDGAASWVRAWNDSDSQTFRMAFDRRSPGTLVASSQSGRIYRTQDRGTTWEEWGEGLPSGEAPYAFDVRPDDGTVFAGLFSTGIFRRGPGDTQWSEANTGLTGYIASSLVVDSVAHTIYAGIRTYGPSLFQSGDGGETWRMTKRGMFYPPVYALLQDSGDPKVLYSGNGGSLFRSENGGEEWVPSDTGMPRGSITVYSLLVDPSGPPTLYAGTTQGVWRSDDRGTTWGTQRLAEATVLALAWQSTPTPRILAGTSAGEVYASPDGGKTWTPLGTGLPAGNPVRAIVSAAGDLFAACDAAGLYRSTDAGQTWHSEPVGASRPAALSLLAPGTAAFSLFVGTDEGVSALDAKAKTWISVSQGLPAGTRVYALSLDTVNSLLYAAGVNGVFVIPLAK